MPIRLPFENLIVPVRQIRARISAIDARPPCRGHRFSAPETVRRRIGRRCPTGRRCARSTPARSARRAIAVSCASAPGAETLLIAVCPAAQASTFERLQSAAKLARSALESEPETLLIWERAASPRPSSRRCMRPSRPSRPQRSALRRSRASRSRAPRLARIDLALGTQIARSRCDVGDLGRQQPGALAHGAAAQHLERGGLSPAASGARAPPEAVVPILRRARAETPRRRRVPRSLAGQWNARRRHRAPRLPAARRGVAGREPRRARASASIPAAPTSRRTRACWTCTPTWRAAPWRWEACTPCMRSARRPRSIAGWRSPKIGSGRSPTSRRTWCARRTARPSR